VEVGCDADDAVLRVVDTGIGIAPDRLGRVFDLFFQGEQALHRGQGGLGIGLTLAKQLVTLHGGSITAESDGKGCGSTFTVRLPRVTIPPTPPSTPIETPRVPRRVLIVEDNADSREMLRVGLESAGHEVFVAEDDLRGVETACAISPHTVFVDIGLPGLDGYEVARRLRQSSGGHEMILVAVTGYGRPEDRQRSGQSGFDFHLVKPIEPSALERILSGGG
jgi:CheY-like chemotaxis protein